MKNSLKMFAKSLVIIILLILWPSAFAYNNTNQLNDNLNLEDAPYVSGELLVKFKENTSKSTQEQIKDKAGAQETVEKIGPAGKQNIQLLELDKNTTVEEAVTKLEKQDSVEYAEPNYIGSGAFTPDDTDFTKQWGLNNTSQTIEGTPGVEDADIDMPEAWANIGSISKTSVIAVLDSGIDADHPDLQGQIWTNSGETGTTQSGDLCWTDTPQNKQTNSCDDDNNGYVDDANGYNWTYINQYLDDDSFSLGSVAPATYSQIAQSFKGNDGYLKKIAVKLKKNGEPSQNIRISIRKNSLDGDNIISVDIDPSAVSTNASWVERTMVAPLIKVNANDTYYLVIQTNNQNAVNNYDVRGNLYPTKENDAYSIGNVSLFDGAWTAGLQDDISFRLSFDAQKDGEGGGIPRDEVGHGTHVSGIIAANNNNNVGIAGIAGYPSNAVKIIPLRVLDSQNFGTYEDWAQAVYYAADNGADIISMSLEGASYSQALQDAINYAANEGLVIVAAAGNNDGNAIRYPAAMENVIGVSATNNADTLADISNYGTAVDLSAPGQDIYSTTPTYEHYFSTYTLANRKNRDYDFYSGTSMATPMVSGVAALIKSKWPTLNASQVEQMMQQNSDDLGTPGRDDYFGSGRLNAAEVFAAPIVPQNLSVFAASQTEASLKWSTSKRADSYRVSYGTDAAATNLSLNTTTNSVKIGSLAPNSTYYFKVRSISNTNGISSYSAIVSVKMYTLTAPSAINQLNISGQTMRRGEYINKTSMVIRTNVKGAPDSAQIGTEVEVKPLNVAFDGTQTLKESSSYTGNPLTLNTTVANLTNLQSYHYRARTFDDKNRVSKWTQFNGGKLAFTVDLNQPNPFAITSVKNGSYVRGFIKLAANPTDNFGISSTAFFKDNFLIRTDNKSPFSVFFSTLTEKNGASPVITAIAEDFAGNTRVVKTQFKVDNYKPRIYAKRSSTRRLSKKKASRYLGLYRYYRTKYYKTRNRVLKRSYKSAMVKYLKAYRLARKGLAEAKIKWKVKDPFTGNKAFVVMKIRKKIYSKSKGSKKMRYLRLYRFYKSKYGKTKNRTLRKRYKKTYNKYYRAYRKTKAVYYKTVKTIRYGWTAINKWRNYSYRTRSAGQFTITIYAKDRAGNNRFKAANNALVIK